MSSVEGQIAPPKPALIQDEGSPDEGISNRSGTDRTVFRGARAFVSRAHAKEDPHFAAAVVEPAIRRKPVAQAARPVPMPLAKRLFDIAFSALVLVLTAPLLLLIALIVRFTSKGPILFRQVRIGEGGEPFTIYKFRSMFAHAPPYEVTPTNDATDSRVTRVGRFLRKSGLDELPQFFCVLKGDMSVVGPRPEMPFIVQAYTERQRRRLRLRPGITGLWQISPARRDPIHKNLQYDQCYYLRRSLGLDLVIVFKTGILTFEGVASLVRSCLLVLWASPAKVRCANHG